MGYGAWGASWRYDGAPSDPFAYNARSGYCRDPETGYYLCGHRYYDTLGRWVTRDPIGYAGGINLYGYCGGNPVGRADPEGEGPWAVAGGILGGALGIGGGPAGVAGGAAFGVFLGSLADGDSPEQAAGEGAGAYIDTGAALTLGDPDILLESVGCNPAAEGEAMAAEEEAGSQCFVARTQVMMADGTTKAVEDVRPGDRVRSRSEKTDEGGRIETAEVEREFELRAKGTLLLRFADGASVEVTAVHPIYAVGKGFTPAGNLVIGDKVAEDRDGKVAVLASVTRLGTPKPVYNLTVGGTHTYFVRAGGDDLWVHNAGQCDPRYIINWDKQGRHIPGHPRFKMGRSELTHPDPQGLINRGIGMGRTVGNEGREIVNFGEPIGTYVDPATNTSVSTTNGLIIPGNTGGHIVPSRP